MITGGEEMDRRERQLELFTLDDIPIAVAAFKEDLELFSVCNEKQMDLQLCLIEAISNGIVHGNQGHSEKKVKVRWCCSTQGFSFAVEDEGEGLSQEKREIKAVSRSLSEHGRGLMLMQEILDEVWFNKQGNMICGKLHW